ncbi:GNAT family N-acetyltransferase [Knoellia subterranea]|uniref:N-acetyltransferase domain-containing protein n=1 Tax=Knoellia subterranea KCTC 19937 TaxID=1385521 RepID=A0A0A0JSB1_9MICO|nr:GNAT family N-acetyltransferase [Knoellia subterranea]KGN39579.1 hypothetical protein N803_01575 [Knoellia subterranea KCTC 19937]
MVDLQDDAVLQQVHDVMERAKALDRPWHEAVPYDEFAKQARHDDPAERTEFAALFEDGRVVAASERWVPMEDNTHMFWGTVHVDPDHRRRGFGAELVKADAERARELGRTTLLAEFFVPGDDVESHPYRAFALAQGFEPGWVEFARHLALPVESDLLAELGASAASASRDYDVEVYAGRPPEQHLPGLCVLYGQLAVDAPTGDVAFEEESVTPERMAKWFDLEESVGRTRLTALAIHRDSGTVAAHSDLIVPAAPSRQVWQWGTFVHREHRGHNLGTAVKVANLERLQRDVTHRTVVRTTNADTNAHMVAINDRLGFEIVERLLAMTMPVSPR